MTDFKTPEEVQAACERLTIVAEKLPGHVMRSAFNEAYGPRPTNSRDNAIAADINSVLCALTQSQARIASAKTVVEDLIMSWVDEGEHGGGADDADCPICQTISAGQDWLRALIPSDGGRG